MDDLSVRFGTLGETMERRGQEAVREVREEMAAERNAGPLLPAPTPD